MNRLILGTALAVAVGCFGTAGRAQDVTFEEAEFVTNQPAATLLLPYFEVSLGTGTNTIFTIGDSSATAVLAHVTVWSDLAVPVLAFNVYLTGYDIVTVNMRDVLNGILPRTASAGQDFGNAISPKGPYSQDINFASCTGQLPPPAVLPAAYVAHVKQSLTGKASAVYSGLCSGLNYGDNIARGYVTIDTVNNCTLRVAGTPGYFGSGGTGDATNQNYLWGEYGFFGGTLARQGGPLVAIRASATDPESSVIGDYTFYGRYSTWTAADNRQPLATRFQARYFVNDVITKPTVLLGWRDPKVNQNPFACGTLPSWYPLSQEEVIAFDSQEEPFIPSSTPVFPPLPGPTQSPFKAAAQKTIINNGSILGIANSGFVMFNLNTAVAAAGSNPPEDPAAAQAWIQVLQGNGTAYRMSHPATPLDSAAETNNHVPSSHQLVGF